MAEVDPQLNLNEPAPVAPAVTTPPAATPTPGAPPDKPVNPNSPKWALDRIGVLTDRAQRAEQQVQERDTELANARELLARLQANPQPPQNQPQPQPRAPIPFPQPQTNDDQRIQAAAREQRFMEDINDARSKGFQEFGAEGFAGTINTLSAIGADNDFLADVLAVDRLNAHKLFHQIAQKPEQAAALAKMNSRQRIAEITRIAMVDKSAPATPTPPKTSAAPEPRPASSGVDALPNDSLGDDVDDATWSRNWDAKHNPRRRSA